jgi:DNA gyrase/topoisomerase IV subunit A
MATDVPPHNLREVVSATLEPEEALMRAVHEIQTVGVSG